LTTRLNNVRRGETGFLLGVVDCVFLFKKCIKNESKPGSEGGKMCCSKRRAWGEGPKEMVEREKRAGKGVRKA